LEIGPVNVTGMNIRPQLNKVLHSSLVIASMACNGGSVYCADRNANNNREWIARVGQKVRNRFQDANLIGAACTTARQDEACIWPGQALFVKSHGVSML
jgi:hypothetical protein